MSEADISMGVEASAPPKEESDGLPEAEFSSLLDSISTFAPLLGSLTGTHKGKGTPREALLLALKPYLSPARCEAIDYLVRVGRIGDALRAVSAGAAQPERGQHVHSNTKL